MSNNHYLPTKVNSYLKRLRIEYEAAEKTLPTEILGEARVLVVEENCYDNWNGGSYGHDVVVFLPLSVLRKVLIRKQKKTCEDVQNDLNTCAEGVENDLVRIQ